MLWKTRRGSSNIEDRRGKSTNGKVLGGSIGALLLGIIIYLFGGNPVNLLNAKNDNGSFSAAQRATEAEDSALVSVVLAETEDVWTEQFKRLGKTYKKPVLILFDKKVESECGYGLSASGPFYCPGDGHVYLDLSFFNLLKERYKVDGDFAMAYVVAHEIGHHVQNLLGTTARVQELKTGKNPVEVNSLSVKQELQADFYAGVWAHYTSKMQLLDSGDVEEAIHAANAIGDDKLQLRSKGYIIPDSFTHGTSQQRVAWFKKGFETGDINQGNTFVSPDL